ncbi:RagB/SusD family nutrient uptake outer membrane protein [Sphingobacterium shayense]|uniref:RagB/SusD family nutrient uptake outer membrane protein n=1 Tax=Sphingobacterium shayense TaxID=626343 RepID=UPI0015535712|nr:RagB/SusD family nutrient uptake outer membrane protein [Sphingobacterium shayense]NQD72543.1 RagB/SusD family nutrient uptake outer membrane protein [Sphingobacterium shayense]
MKRNYIYSCLLATALTTASCSSSFLDVEPVTDVLENNFYKDVADAEMALVGCYDGYQRTVSNGSLSFNVASDVLSDQVFGATGNTDSRAYQVLDRFSQAEAPSENNLFDGTWKDYYAAIYRCNVLLTKLDETDFSTDPEARIRIEGETKFLRALLYFDLVRLFENIPLLVEPSTENIPQANPKETYDLIVSDLEFAAESIPVTAYPKAKASANDGRATTYAAKSLLARVYLFYSGYYHKDDLAVSKAEVLAGLEDVINSGEFSLVDDFLSLWPASSYIPVNEDNTLDRSRYAGEGNREVVFAQKFTSTQDYNGNNDGNRWLVMLGLRGVNASPYGQGWGAGTVSKNFVTQFAKNDTRKGASIIDIEAEGIVGFDLSDQREYTGFAIKKYTPTSLPDGTSNTGGQKDFQISQDQDFFVIRFADVLLMAAELGSGNAQNYFDRVRKRAYKDSFSSLAATKINILNERKFEFAFEGIRYWDLLRQGLESAATSLAFSESVLSGSAEDKVVITRENFLSTRGFMQIPNNQITLSDGVLIQNDGWK